MSKAPFRIGKSGWVGDTLVSLSMANLLMASIWGELLYSQTQTYYIPQHGWHAHLSAVIVLFLLTFFFLFVLRTFVSTASRPIQLLCLLAFLIYMALTAGTTRYLTGLNTDFILMLMKNWEMLSLLMILLTIAVVRYLKIAFAVVYLAFFIFFPFSLLHIAKAAMHAAQDFGTAEHLVYEDKTAFSADGIFTPKTIFLIFDELGYKALFEEKHDKKDMDLKNFMYLRDHSLFFSKVPSMWISTTDAIPAITIGQNISSKLLDGDLWVVYQDGRQQPWSESDNLFSTLAGAGKKLAAAGTFHDYCGIFSESLHDCTQRYFPALTGVQPINGLYQGVRSYLASLSPFHKRIEAMKINQHIENSVLGILGDSEIDFVFAHFMMPHTPNIYDRKKKSYDPFKFGLTYLDNLQLTDDVLGRIIDQLKRMGIWDTSTLIVSSDHHWRMRPDMYADSPPNLPLLIKLPGQSTQHPVSSKVPPTKIRPIVEKIVLEKEYDPERIEAWLQE